MVRKRERESQQDIRNWQKGTTNREREGDGEIRMGRLSWSRLPLVPLLLLRAQRVSRRHHPSHLPAGLVYDRVQIESELTNLLTLHLT